MKKILGIASPRPGNITSIQVIGRNAGLTLLVWLLLLSCATSPRLPEGDIKPVFHLERRSLVRFECAVERGIDFPRDALSELLASALEQSRPFDFIGPMARPLMNPSALLTVEMKRLPGSVRRIYMHARVRARGKDVPLNIFPRTEGFAGILLAVDSLSRTVRRMLGESTERILSSSVPLGVCCTSWQGSLELLAKARKAVRENKPGEAREILFQCLEKDPKSPKAIIAFAYLSMSTGDMGRLSRLLEKGALASRWMSLPDRHRLRRLSMMYARDYAKLVTLGEEFIERFPGNPEGYATKGLGLDFLGQYAKAKAIWTYLHRRDSSSIRACLHLGLCLFGEKRFEEAGKIWKNLVRPGFPLIQRTLFSVLPHIGEKDFKSAVSGVLHFLGRAKGSARDRAWLHLVLCSIHILSRDKKNSESEAGKVLEESLADPVGTSRVWTLAARYLVFRGKTGPPRQFIMKISRLGKYSALSDIKIPALWLIGWIYTVKRNWKKAEEVVAELFDAGGRAEAAELRAMLPSISRRSDARLYNLGEAYARRKSPWNAYRLGAALVQEGKEDRGRAILERIVDRGLNIDLAAMEFHPLLNPMSAVALVEAEYILSR